MEINSKTQPERPLKRSQPSSNTPLLQPSHTLALMALVKLLAQRAAEVDHLASIQKIEINHD